MSKGERVWRGSSIASSTVVRISTASHPSGRCMQSFPRFALGSIPLIRQEQPTSLWVTMPLTPAPQTLSHVQLEEGLEGVDIVRQSLLDIVRQKAEDMDLIEKIQRVV